MERVLERDVVAADGVRAVKAFVLVTRILLRLGAVFEDDGLTVLAVIRNIAGFVGVRRHALPEGPLPVVATEDADEVDEGSRESSAVHVVLAVMWEGWNLIGAQTGVGRGPSLDLAGMDDEGLDTWSHGSCIWSVWMVLMRVTDAVEMLCDRLLRGFEMTICSESQSTPGPSHGAKSGRARDCHRCEC